MWQLRKRSRNLIISKIQNVIPSQSMNLLHWQKRWTKHSAIMPQTQWKTWLEEFSFADKMEQNNIKAFKETCKPKNSYKHTHWENFATKSKMDHVTTLLGLIFISWYLTMNMRMTFWASCNKPKLRKTCLQALMGTLFHIFVKSWGGCLRHITGFFWILNYYSFTDHSI